MRGEVDKLKILIALIFVFQGMSIAVIQHPLLKSYQWMRLFGVFLMVMGILYIYFKYHIAKVSKEKKIQEKNIENKTFSKSKNFSIQIQKDQINKDLGKIDEVEDKSILIRSMYWISKKAEKISPYTIPIIGAIVVDAVIIYNILINKSINLRGFDAITITFGISLILYNYIPKQFQFARDFFVFFLGLLFFILIFPPIFYNLLFGEGGDAFITKTLLGDPVSGILNLGGIESYCKIINTSTRSETATVFFTLSQTGEEASVGIAEACSGIYTLSIFLSAFITFVLLEYKRFDRKVALLIGIGIFTTYIANLLRMTIIILVGHYYDTDPNGLPNLAWTHINAGWIIFMAWIIPFWWLMYRFLMKKDINKNFDEIEK